MDNNIIEILQWFEFPFFIFVDLIRLLYVYLCEMASLSKRLEKPCQADEVEETDAQMSMSVDAESRHILDAHMLSKPT